MLVCFTSVMHVMWGILLLSYGSTIAISATRVVVHMFPNYEVEASIYITCGLLPVVLFWRPGSVAGLISVIPQQLLLIASGISAIVSISTGTYADMTPRAPMFIFMDQGIYLILPILYAFEAVDRYVERKR